MPREPITRLVGQNIRRYRRRLGMTIEEFADRVGVSPQQISRVELGLNSSPLPRLQRMAEVLGVSVADLLPSVSPPGPDHLQLALRSTGLTDAEIKQVLAFARMLRQAGGGHEGDEETEGRTDD